MSVILKVSYIPDERKLGVGMATASENNVVLYNNYVQVKAV